MAANAGKPNKNERREQARIQAEKLRAAQAKREKRNRSILIGAVVAVVALIAVAGFFIYQQSNKTLLSDFAGEVPAGSTLTGGIPVGATGAGTPNEGAPEVDLYIDFMCPGCGAFEQTNGADVAALVADGSATAVIHPLGFLDRMSQGTAYSTRTANAFATVANDAPEAAMPFLQALFASQPEENSTGLTDEEIAVIAVEAGVPQAVADTLAEGTFTEWVGVATQQAGRDGVSRTPSIFIGGEQWTEDWTQPGAFRQAVLDAA